MGTVFTAHRALATSQGPINPALGRLTQEDQEFKAKPGLCGAIAFPQIE